MPSFGSLSRISSLTAFIRKHADSSYVDEAKLLLGDAYFAQGELEDGMVAYASIAPESTRFFEEGYFKSGKALKLSERYEDMEAHYQKFAEVYPKSARLPDALSHLAWLKQHEGDLEGARLAYWKALDEHGDDAEKPTVLDLILGLQKLYDGDEQDMLSKAWEAKRAEALKSKQATYAVRCLWARGMLLQRRSPAQAAVFLRQMEPELNPEICSARLLVDVADAFAQTEALPEAASIYQDIVKWHPNALERDRAEVGLGQEAMRKKDYAKALSHFSRVERRQSGVVPLGQLLLVKASCQDLAGDRRAGLKTLKGLLAEKSVTSGQKAEALMRSGQWLAEGKEENEALAYFERVYLVYGRYASLVSTAYWSRGQLLEKLGETEKAQEVYREFVAREELKTYPEYALAKERVSG